MKNNICYQHLYWMDGEKFAQRVIVSAANKYVLTNGQELIIPCVRHANTLLLKQLKVLISAGLLETGWCLCENQGFVDQYCNWWSREDAFIIAQQAGQIDLDRNGSDSRLYSEGLY